MKGVPACPVIGNRHGNGALIHFFLHGDVAPATANFFETMSERVLSLPAIPSIHVYKSSFSAPYAEIMAIIRRKSKKGNVDALRIFRFKRRCRFGFQVISNVKI
jgi:hypothetical protein